MRPDDDILGFAVETRGGEGPPPRPGDDLPRVTGCWDLRKHLKWPTGIPLVGEPNEGWEIQYDAVLAGKMPCPLWNTCKKRKRAMESPTARLKYPHLYEPEPRQLALPL